MDSNLIYINSSLNFFESTIKKPNEDYYDDKDILVVNSKKNLNKNF